MSLKEMKKYELSFQKNIRDLGGLVGLNGRKIKYGRLYRGGALHHLNEEDVEIINSLHLTDVIDFRADDEFVHRPDYPFEGVTFHNFPVMRKKMNQEAQKHDDGNLLWFIEGNKSGFDHLRLTYVEMVDDPAGQEAYRRFFELLCQDHKVFYFHCSQGKDRAGLAAYLIETILGVDEKTKREDYLLSNEAMVSRADILISSVENKLFFTPEYRQSLIDVFSARIEYLDEALKVIDEKYGGIDNYIENILHVDVKRMRGLYLD